MTALFIHGAWHGAWAWEPVLRHLPDAVAVDLPGLGQDSANLTPEIGLYDHIRAAKPEKPSILVAHSYGGIVARGVADRWPDLVRDVFLVEALWPENGESALNLIAPVQAASMSAQIRDHGDGWRIPPPDPIAFDLPNPALAPGISERMTHHPARTFIEPIAVTGRTPRPGRYLVSSDRPAKPYANTVARMRALGWPIDETTGGHELPMTAPERIVEILKEMEDQ